MLCRLTEEGSELQRLTQQAGRALCSLAAPTQPRRVMKPAVRAIIHLCSDGGCVVPLLDAGGGAAPPCTL